MRRRKGRVFGKVAIDMERKGKLGFDGGEMEKRRRVFIDREGIRQVAISIESAKG